MKSFPELERRFILGLRVRVDIRSGWAGLEGWLNIRLS
jgi:hypothetical protein